MANREKITQPELSPEIVLFHILPKLPAKSLLRFKCVCKQWLSFLTSPLFAKTYLHHVTTVDRHRHEKVLFFPDKPRTFQTIDCEDGSLAKPRCYPFAGYALMIASNSVNNGLVCVGIGASTKELCDIILWNPLTDEYKTLSRPIDTNCYNMLVMTFELYYTCCDDDYKILRVTIDGNVYIYSLKSDSWRRLKSTLRESIPYAGAGDHNLLDGKLHFMVPGSIIIRLDLKTEKLTKIAVPHGCEHGEFRLMVVRGCIELTVFKEVRPGTWIIEMWRMNGDGNWTKMVNISYSHDPNQILLPLYLMRNGNLIICIPRRVMIAVGFAK